MNAMPVSEPGSQSGNVYAGNPPALWNPTAAGAWSLIFNPLFGAVLILLNWQALGVREQIRRAQLWLIVSIAMLVVSFFIPAPFGTAIFLAYLLIWYLFSAKAQARYIRDRWGQAYPRRSWLWPLLIALIAALILFAIAFVIVFMQALLSQ